MRRVPLMRDRIMKMDGIEKGSYAHLPMSVLRDQTEGISNKYRMPQKCTLPSGGPGARTGSAHPNTIFIMPWPRKVITLDLDDWGRIRCQGELSEQKQVSPVMDRSLPRSILSLSNTQSQCQCRS